MSLVDIKSAAENLAENERADLAVWLLDSLPPPCRGDERLNILDEAKRRRAQLDTGEAASLSSADFWASLDSDESECA